MYSDDEDTEETTYDPCLTYSDDDSLICFECDTGYSLLLFNQTRTICALVEQDSSGDYQCIIDSSYSYEYSYAETYAITYYYYSDSNLVTPFCFDCESYYYRDGDQLCSFCTQQDSTDDYFLQSVYSKSFGCVDCSNSDYDSYYVSYNDNLQVFLRECESSSTYTEACSLTQYYDTDSDECLECTDLYDNCAACDSSECLLCAQDFYWHSSVYDYQTQSYIGKCVFDQCPVGYCKNPYTQVCEVSTINNCTHCSVNADSEQICDLCVPGYLPNQDDSGLTCTALDLTVNLTYYVIPGAPVFTTDYSYDFSNANGTDIAEPFFFLQEAFYAINAFQYSNYSKYINATIYLGKGNHFFFQCDGDESTTTYTSSLYTSLVKYCENQQLQKVYTINDNIKINIKPLNCTLNNTLGYFQINNTYFSSYCLESGKPTIFVNNANTYFNISGIAIFENIKFSGINAMVVPSDSTHDLSVFPVKFCSISTEPTGYDGKLKLKNVSDTNTSSFSFSCIDSWYDGSSKIDIYNTTRRCQINNNEKFYPYQESTLVCKGDILDSTFFYQNSMNVYSKRRYTLFNLYSFANYTSQYKSPPFLNLTNCDFEYFLGGYESLINVENNNLQQVFKNTEITTENDGTYTSQKEFYIYNGVDKGVKILINRSTFKHSRFCKGMIVYRKQLFIPNIIMSYANYTHIYSFKGNNDSGASVIIFYSTFNNLNTYTNVSAMAIYGGVLQYKTLTSDYMLEDIEYSMFMHKGIVLNFEDYGGTIEIAKSTFTRNFHYIPEILMPPESTDEEDTLDQFKDIFVTSEYKMCICDQDYFYDSYFFQKGFSTNDDFDLFFDKLERLGLIYISRNRLPMIIRSNTFWRNIGTFGGAITINSPNFKKTTKPYVIIYDNSFEGNQAYFSGNAIYIRPTKTVGNIKEICGGVLIKSSTFTNNIGTKAHNGGAIGGYCSVILYIFQFFQYLDKTDHEDYLSSSSMSNKWVATDSATDVTDTVTSILNSNLEWSVQIYKFHIDLSTFYENFSGQKGSAVYLKQMSKVKITSSIFQQNGPVYALIEAQYSPWWTYLGGRSLTYTDLTDLCGDEFNYINYCASGDYMIDWPNIKGAVYIQHCEKSACMTENEVQQLIMTNTSFINNDVGPIVNILQESEDMSSSLYIEGGFTNTISKSKFINHIGNYDYLTSLQAPKINAYFPSWYFTYAQAPIVRLKVAPPTISDLTILFQTYFSSCTFQNNKHVNILGIHYTKQYYGSLIALETSYEYGLKFIPQLLIQNSIIRDNKFLGNETALIYLFKGLINFTDNTAFGNGYLTDEETITKTKLISSSTYFPYESYIQYMHQSYGIIYFNGQEKFPNWYYHQILRNSFQFNFAYKGSAAALRVDNQFALFQSNTYKYNYAIQGSAMYARNNDGRTTIKFLNESMNLMFAKENGCITGEPNEVDFLSILVYNSTFKNCWAESGSSIFTDSLAYGLVSNCLFFDDFWIKNKTAVIATYFKGNQWKIYDLIDYNFLYTLTDDNTRKYGQIYMEQGYNSDNVYFVTDTILKSSAYLSEYSEIVDCYFYNITSKSGGSAIMSNKDQLLRIRNTKTSNRLITNCTHQSYGAIRIQMDSEVYIENIYFKNNIATLRGGALSVSESKVYCTNCTFYKNTAYDKAIVYVFTDSEFSCDYCYFYQNYANDSSGIFAINNQDGSIAVTNSLFQQNTHYQNLINLVFTDASFTNTSFIDNIASVVNHGITLINSDITVYNITVNYLDRNFLYNNKYTVDTGFFSLNFMSTMTMKQSLIENCRGAIAAVLYATGSSTVKISENTHIRNSYSQTGSAMYFTMTNEVSINKTVFYGNSQYDIYIDKSSATIMNSDFFIGSQQFISAHSASLVIQNSNFQDGSNQDIQGKGIYCQCNSLTIERSTFRNLSALEGGALYLTSSSSSSTFTLKSNNFIENLAMHGGAVYVRDAATLQMIANKFIGNKAEIIDPSTFTSSKLQQIGQGGALLMDCDNQDLELDANCQMTFSESNLFQDNYAENDGGAIAWISNKYLDDGTTTFENNSAPYGMDISSYPKNLLVQFIDNNDYYNRITNDPLNVTRLNEIQGTDSGRQLESISFPEVVSGISFSFLVYIIDQDDIVYSTDNSSIATLKTSNVDDVILKNYEVTANEGVYNFSDITIIMRPGTSAILTLQITGLDSDGNTVEFLENPQQFYVKTRQCVLGESYSIDYRCVQCLEGEYLFYAPDNYTLCKECPSTAVCYGSSIVAPQSGYWRSSNVSENFIACPNTEACLAGDQSNPTGICATGYTGILCGNCASGYKKSSQFICSKCPNSILNAIQFVGLMFAMLAIVVFMVRSTLLSADKVKPLHSVYLKILTNHIQIVGIVAGIDYNWPSQLEDLQEGSSQVSSLSEQVFSLDCFMIQSGVSTENIYSMKLVFYVLLPVILSLLAIGFWVVYGKIRNQMDQIRDKIISTVVILLFLIHPTIAKVLFQAFNCIEVDNVNRLRDDISNICYEGEHLVYVIAIALPGVIIWSFGIPLLALFLLLRNKKIIFQMQDIAALPKPDLFLVTQFKTKYGFLFNGFRIQTFFWEVIIMYRKILLVMTTVFLSVVSSDAQVLLALLILIINMVLQVQYNPYYTLTLNRMEHYSLLVCALTLYAGMFYVTGTHYSYMNNDALKWFFIMLVIIPNSVFLLYWLNSMRVEIFKIIFQRSKRLFRIITLGRVDLKEFERRHFSSQPGGINKNYEERVDDYDAYSHNSEKTNPANPDDFSNVIMKNFYRKKETPSSSDSDFNFSKKFEKTFQTGSDIEDAQSHKRKSDILKVSDVKLDFPEHMMKKVINKPRQNTNLNNQIDTTITSERKDLLTSPAPSSRELVSYRKVFPEKILFQANIEQRNSQDELNQIHNNQINQDVSIPSIQDNSMISFMQSAKNANHPQEQFNLSLQPKKKKKPLQQQLLKDLNNERDYELKNNNDNVIISNINDDSFINHHKDIVIAGLNDKSDYQDFDVINTSNNLMTSSNQHEILYNNLNAKPSQAFDLNRSMSQQNYLSELNNTDIDMIIDNNPQNMIQMHELQDKDDDSDNEENKQQDNKQLESMVSEYNVCDLTVVSGFDYTITNESRLEKKIYTRRRDRQRKTINN